MRAWRTIQQIAGCGKKSKRFCPRNRELRQPRARALMGDATDSTGQSWRSLNLPPKRAKPMADQRFNETNANVCARLDPPMDRFTGPRGLIATIPESNVASRGELCSQSRCSLLSADG